MICKEHRVWRSGCALGNGLKKGYFSQGGKSAAFICALSTGGRQTSAFPHPLRLSLGFRGIFNLLLCSAGKRSSSWVRGLRPGQVLPPRLLRQDTPQLPVHLPPVSGQPFPHHTATRDISLSICPPLGLLCLPLQQRISNSPCTQPALPLVTLSEAYGKALGFDTRQLVTKSAGASCTLRRISWRNLPVAGGKINSRSWGCFFYCPFSLFYFLTS